MKFQKATRKQAKLRLALTGPSGSGKTYSALLMASGMGGKIAVIDTERSSASLYSHLVEFDALDLAPPYTPERFIQAIEAAEEAGYDILVVDSITHEWSGVGGCLELVDEVARSKYKGNSWSAWNDITPRHRAFLDKMMASNLHIIATMRSKTDTAQVDEGGRKRVVKLGMKSEQRDGAEYEFTIVLDLVHDGHFATASKDRTGLFAGDPKPISAETGQRVIEWLHSGEPLKPETPKAESGGVTPTAGATDRIDPDRREMVSRYVDALRDACERQDGLAAAQLTSEIQDADEKTAVWSLLNSGERSFIKKALKEAA
ncbi:MAG: ATP-binding protein [Myxococcales bacterium]|nr:ATP-binding protein [Myxococcales bacterium]